MRTPFDAALRALEREMDALRADIARGADRLHESERLHDALTAHVSEESAIACAHGAVSGPYLVRMRDERSASATRHHEAEIVLALLRRRAAQQYASIMAVEGAAESYRHDAEQALARTEQALIDDAFAARFVRRMRDLRRAAA